ncbi:MAG: hypothetical protein N3G20_04365, partial [Verrucomicrobiae bacterium]|nr:hypothetical protein [Verrucomicrobiae bacterium]
GLSCSDHVPPFSARWSGRAARYCLLTGGQLHDLIIGARFGCRWENKRDTTGPVWALVTITSPTLKLQIRHIGCSGVDRNRQARGLTRWQAMSLPPPFALPRGRR